jgi:lipopolysaccharide biosynthesis glycosyltransferase
MNTNPIEIVFIATSNYAPFVATTALSIIENTKEQVNFHVLTENFKTEDKNTIKDFFISYQNVSFEFIDVTEKLKVLEGTQLCWFKSYLPSARILIPEILPQLPKAIYMEVDIIVNCDIKELWDIDFHYDGKEYALGAMKGWKPNDDDIKNLAISPKHKYFNSGILILNCDKWRTEKITDKLINRAKESKIKLRYPDQDLLNIYFDNNNYVPFDAIYNYQPAFSKENENFCPKMIHYTREKPWENEDCFFSELFWIYAKRTPYYAFFRHKLKRNMDAKRNFAAKLRAQITKQ